MMDTEPIVKDFLDLCNIYTTYDSFDEFVDYDV